MEVSKFLNGCGEYVSPSSECIVDMHTRMVWLHYEI